jgi:TRAP-type mannitol/chloroaromatic compound transport system substrate-binding protein
MGGWFRKEIKSVDDLKGLKMRIPGYGGKVMAGVGAVPTNLPAGELYQALERGTIDALEWVGPSLDLRMGFHKVAPYYYTGWHEPSTELIYMFNKEKLNSLPAWAQSILRNAAKLTSYNATTETFHESAQNWDSITTEYPNVEIRSFPESVISALKASNAKLLEEAAAGGGLAKEIIASQAAYLKKARAWTNIGDKAYLNTIVD